MSLRPSSSGGPSSKSSANSFKYDKRISRDDSFINHRTGTGPGFKPYGSARGQLPTPEASPQTSPQPKVSISNIRMPTPESINEIQPTEIGMALGSPTMNPASGSLRTPQAPVRNWQGSTPSLVSPAPGVSTTIGSPEKSLRRKQSGRWRLFGMFGRKQPDHPPPPPRELKDIPLPRQPTEAPSKPRNTSKVERSNTVGTRRTPTQKPIAPRSQTMPYDGDSSAQESKSTLRGGSKETHGRIPIALDNKPASSGPLLDVEIPEITMERYSVMFGSVLQSQSSLLSRRQGNVQKLKTTDNATINDKGEKHYDIPRRVSSPAGMSPSLALFPPSTVKKSTQTSHSASSRLRSNTSPAEVRSPSKVSFDHMTSHRRKSSKDDVNSHPHQGPHLGPSVHRYQKDKLTIATLAREREQQQAAAREHQFSPETSSLILDSPTQLSSPEIEVVRSEPVRTKASYMQEPKWQMMTPPNHTSPTVPSSSTSDKKKTNPLSPTASTHSDLSRTPQNYDDDDDDDDDDDIVLDSSKMDPVELSIARQISISRQQRKMLKPLHTGSVRRQRPPMPKIAMAQNERLAETKASTPTIVTPDEEEAAESPLAYHRKSERVVLDRA
ncbi:uncharacterized protein F4812DRAFT_452156 [Daldinia caldariorum]|uniref:uncharacterized protein n=1 Tax=Daldinia caldariorum TaxID=326644 RepID=UPI002007D86C|nr:uncharacterized protein F4812DRAFT_452156 [Daldinia caldariorum]KAI1465610.1 hypothetical protein F4812DRAFT_452156 [Daldinia caldariorum]